MTGWLCLTRPDGSLAYLRASAVHGYAPALPGEYDAHAQSVVYSYAGIWAVREPPAVLRVLIEHAEAR